MAPSQLETGGQKAVQGTVLDAKSRLSALIKAGFSRFHKVPLIHRVASLAGDEVPLP